MFNSIQFSFQHRGMVTSFVSSVDALSDFLQTKAYDPLLKLLGIHWVFILFSIVCFGGTFYTIMWVPETKDRTVEEIYALLEDGRQKEKRKDAESGKQHVKVGKKKIKQRKENDEEVSRL